MKRRPAFHPQVNYFCSYDATAICLHYSLSVFPNLIFSYVGDIDNVL